MKHFALVAIVLAMIALVGCKGGNSTEKVADLEGRIEKIERDTSASIKDLSGRIGDLGGRIQALEKQTGSNLPIEATTGGDTKAVSASDPAGQEKNSNLAKEYEQMRQDLAALQTQYEELKKRVETSPLKATPDGYADDWRAMSDPKKLGEKLDKFAKDFSPKLDAAGQSAEFESDMEQFKNEATKEYTRDELLAKYKASIQKQMDEATDERMKEWYNRQIQALDQSSGDTLDARLENYRRYENMRALSELAKKYKISRNDFRNYGLQIYGGGWSPSEGGGNQ
jgi:hypothetical protein